MADIVRQKTLLVYAKEDGKEPYTDWLLSLKDYVIRSRIIRRIERLKQGNYGDCKPVGDGVFELRFFFGSGYRVYFGESANDLVILLCGGDKDSQNLYRVLSPEGNPELRTISLILHNLGYRLSVQPIQS